jgi:hypothetical protein
VAGVVGTAPSTDNHAEEATIVSLEGRMYPVEVAYLQDPTEDYVSEAVRVVWGLHMQVSTVFYQTQMRWLNHDIPIAWAGRYSSVSDWPRRN